MYSSKIKSTFKRLTSIIIAMFSFAILIIGLEVYIHAKKNIWETEVKTRLSEILMTKSIELEKNLYARIHYTKSIAAYVSLKPDISNREFQDLADELIKKDPVISTMALAKDCVINNIYPYEGHEAAIGLNLLAHPERVEIVEKTIETRKPFIAGPVDLVEGGVAFISYTPIFDRTKSQTNNFWGIADIVIHQDKLVKQAGINQHDSGFDFAIRGYNGLGNNGAVWWGDEKVFEQQPVTVNVDLPYGNWVIGAVPEVGWSAYLKKDKHLHIMMFLGTVVISILVWLFSKAMVKIRTNEKELSAIFNSIDGLIIDFDNEGRYINIPPVNSNLLYLSPEKMLNKTVYDIFPKEKAELFHRHILKCLKTRKLVEFEYPLEIDGKIKWFDARISWKAENRVIYHAIDITDRKKAENVLEQQARQLKIRNEELDAYSHTVAHDLKNPIATVIGFATLLNDGFIDKSESEIKQYIDAIIISGEKALQIINSLLMLANVRMADIKTEELNMKNVVDESLKHLKQLINDNNVEIKIPDRWPAATGNTVWIENVWANYLSNAVKYGGKPPVVELGYDEESSGKATKGMIRFWVRDNGSGISKKNQELLFKTFERLEQVNITGHGLGLSIVSRIINKLGGGVGLESELGHGSLFYFTLPAAAIKTQLKSEK